MRLGVSTFLKSLRWLRHVARIIVVASEQVLETVISSTAHNEVIEGLSMMVS